MAKVQVKLHAAAMRAVLTSDVAPAIRDATSRIAAGAAGAAGVVNGSPVEMDTDFGVTSSGRRYRGAIILHHPTPKGRQAARDALRGQGA